jgi:hypothetical protein
MFFKSVCFPCPLRLSKCVCSVVCRLLPDSVLPALLPRPREKEERRKTGTGRNRTGRLADEKRKAGCLLPVWVRAHYVLKEEFFASGMLAMTNHRQVQFFTGNESRISQAKNDKCLSLSRLL